MNYQNLTEGDCGEVNSLAEFSRHIVQDVARQDNKGHRSGSSGLGQNNVMPPQSFRMHELINEMKTIESQSSFIPTQDSATSLDSQWTTNNHVYQENRGYSSFLPVTSLENVNIRGFGDQPPWNIGLPNPQVTLPFYPQNNNFHPQFEENLDNFDNKSEVFVHSVYQLDDIYKRKEQNKSPLEKKVQHDTELKPVSQKYWSGIPIYDESGLSNMLANKTEAHTFMKCLMNYGKKSNDEQWIPPNLNERRNPELLIVRDKLIPLAEEYPYIINNPMRNCDNPFIIAQQEFFKGNIEEAILYADEAARQNPEDINRWRFLRYIYQNELKYLESFYAAKQILRLDPSHTMAHNMMTIAYLQGGCFYEAFETMVHWLQHHKSYGDIPLNFSMEENLSGLDTSTQTWIDSNRHIINGVKNMLLTAARRNPKNADLAVQSFLSFVFSFTMEYDKSADCLTTIARSAEENVTSGNSCYNAGINLFLCGKPHEALEYLLIGIENSEKKVKDITYELIGIIYMYLTNYREAIRYFKKALEIDPLDEEFALPNRGDILQAENELCLLLYSKLYNKLYI